MQTLLVDQPADGVTRITLNRPDKLNALTYELVSRAARRARGGRRRPRLPGRGPHRRRSGVLRRARPQRLRRGRRHRGAWAGSSRASPSSSSSPTSCRTCGRIRQPVIAAVNGPAAGGGLALALASDIRICGESARFGAAFVRLGLSGCDIGVSWLLPRLIGASRAFELMLTGRVVDAAEADRSAWSPGWCPTTQLLDTALDVADRIAANSPFGVWMTKEVMWSNLEIAGRAARASTSRTAPRSWRR